MRRALLVILITLIILFSGCISSSHDASNNSSKNVPVKTVDSPTTIPSLNVNNESNSNISFKEVNQSNQNQYMAWIGDMLNNGPSWQKKLDTPLLELVNSTFVLPGRTQNDTINNLKHLGVYYSKDDYNKKFGSINATTRQSNMRKANDDVVFVYINVKPDASIDKICQLVVTNESLSTYYKNYSEMFAVIEISNIQTIASLDDVLTIHTITPPVTN